MAWLGFDLCPGLPKFRIKVKLCLLLGEGLRLRDWLMNVEGIGLWPEPWQVLDATMNSTAFQQLRTVSMSVCMIAGHVCIACIQRWGGRCWQSPSIFLRPQHTAYSGVAGPRASGGSPVFASHLTTGEVGSQLHTGSHGLQRFKLTVSQKVLNPLCHPQPVMSPFPRRRDEGSL